MNAIAPVSLQLYPMTQRRTAPPTSRPKGHHSLVSLFIIFPAGKFEAGKDSAVASANCGHLSPA